MLSYAPFESAEQTKPTPVLVATSKPHPLVNNNVVPQTVIEVNYILMAFIACVILLVLQDSRSI
jgi:hypothetical protein